MIDMKNTERFAHGATAGTVLFFMAALLSPQRAFAMPITEIFAAQSACDIGSQFQGFKAAAVKEEPSATSTEGLASSTEEEKDGIDPELIARQELLGQILSCAKRDVDRLLSAVDDIALTSVGAKDLQANITERLERALEKIDSLQKRVDDATTIDETKEIARDLGAWRKDVYVGLTENAGLFIVWANGETLLEKAENRIFQVRQTLKSLKLQDQVEIQRLFEQAKVQSLHAEENHLKAKQGIERFSRSEEIVGYIRASLDDLHGFYGTLLNLSTIVAKTVRQ